MAEHERMHKKIARILLPALALIVVGCGKTEKSQEKGADEKKTVKEKKTAGHVMPTIPGEGVDNDVAMENPLKSFERKDDDFYRFEPEMPSGGIRVLCHFEKNATLKLPARKAYDVAAPGIIKDPLPKELEYFKQFRNRKALPERNYGPAVGGAVIWAQKIKEGPAKVPGKIGFMIWCSGYRGRPKAPIAALVPDKIHIRNTDPFPVPIVITHMDTGKKVFEAELPPHTKVTKGKKLIDTWNKHQIPGGSWYLTNFLNSAKVTMSPLLKDLGRYEITSKRHKFIRYQFWLTQNPYIAWSDGKGKLSLGGLPEGKHTFVVWHPTYEPVEQTFDVDIKKGANKEIQVAFKVPAK